MLPTQSVSCLTPRARPRWGGSPVVPDVAPPHITAMPYHRFKVGQTVVAPFGGPHALIPRGPHVITRLLPLVDREPQYRVQSKIDGHERVVRESQIRLVEKGG